MTLEALIRQLRVTFSNAGIASPDLDARFIVEHFTGTTRADAFSHPGAPVATEVLAQIHDAAARRLAGEPVHRILGFREFYGLKLKLSAATLEPRPDTETLVDAVLPIVRQKAEKQGGCRILDLGTGTGAIALALLHEVADAGAVGADISDEALRTAAKNAHSLGLGDRFQPVRSNWFKNISGLFDVIVSNPPYIRSEDLAGLTREVREFDPKAALDGGEDGLEAYRAIAESARKHLSAGGVVAVETGFDQRLDVNRLFTHAGFRIRSFHKDFGGNDRVILLE
jgi:release factor glutamine methyltransferase